MRNFILTLLACAFFTYADRQGAEKSTSGSVSSKSISYLALGDSYTVAAAEVKTNSYPYQLVESLRKKGMATDTAKVVAGIGWTTRDLLAALKRLPTDQKYDVVTILIGVNNQFQRLNTEDYRTDFDEILKSAIILCKGGIKRVFVLSIPDWSITAFGKIRNPVKIAAEIETFNKINKEESVKSKVNYIDITSLSLDAEDDASYTAQDGLHPSGKMYASWVKRITPKIMQSFK